MRVKFRGAVTFETDESLTEGLNHIQKLIEANRQSLLTMEHIEPLGLHVTIHYTGDADNAQLQASRIVIKTLAESAYSGYVDLWVDDGDPERFHAKEIGYREITIEDIANT
ncbi:MAG: hypothetical protein WBC91_03945 [Phototrophicaceae bacterium]